jgi:hypothetical protein
LLAARTASCLTNRKETVVEQQDVVQEAVYEAPALMDAGDFAEVTLGGHGGLFENYSLFENA